MDHKFARKCVLTLSVALPVVLILGMAVEDALSGHWEHVIVVSPLLVAAVPGYWGLLPRGGMRHGLSCECTKPDAACELGFWFEIGQKLLLVLPLALASIFLYSIFLSRHDFSESVMETSLAALTAIGCLAVCAGAVYLMVKKCNRET